MGEPYTFPLTFDGSTRKKKMQKCKKMGAEEGVLEALWGSLAKSRCVKQWCLPRKRKKNFVSSKKCRTFAPDFERKLVGVLAHLARARDWQSRGNRFDSDILHRRGRKTASFCRGVLAHLVEHLVRNQKVIGSSPIYSTKEAAKRPFFVKECRIHLVVFFG